MRARIGWVIALLLFAAPAAAVVLPLIENEITPGSEGLAHPGVGIITLPIPVSVGGNPRVCVRYKTTLATQNGRVVVRVELHRNGSVIEKVKFRGLVEEAQDPVYKRQFFGCSQVECPADSPAGTEPCVPNKKKELNSALHKDDALVFVLKYRKFSSLGAGDKARVIVGALP